MPRYLVEAYVADSPVAFRETRERARRAEALGSGVQYLHTTFLPADETVFHLFEAPSVEALGQAGRLAALAFERIVEAIDGSTDGIEEAER